MPSFRLLQCHITGLCKYDSGVPANLEILISTQQLNVLQFHVKIRHFYNMDPEI